MHIMRILLTLSLLVIIIASCEKKPKINPDIVIDTTSVVDDRLADTTKVLVASLPTKFDSTEVLLYTVGLVDLNPDRGTIIKSEYYSSGPNSGSVYYHEDEISGNFINMIFKVKIGEERKLTDRKMVINQAVFLRKIFKTTGNMYLLYFIYDRDTNGDGNLDYQDLEALYLSRLDGTELTKISRELHDFNDYTFVNDESRIYFRTLEDRNHDGLLTKRDVFHHYYIAFTEKGYTVTEHDPLKIFNSTN